MCLIPMAANKEDSVILDYRRMSVSGILYGDKNSLSVETAHNSLLLLRYFSGENLSIYQAKIYFLKVICSKNEEALQHGCHLNIPYFPH